MFGGGISNAVLLTEDFGVPADSDPILTGVAFTDANKNNFYDPGEGLGDITITATRTTDNAVFSTTTWAAGGYSLQLAPGTYSVSASGAGIGNPVSSTVTLGAQNVELDFTPGSGATSNAAPSITTQPTGQTVTSGGTVTFTAAANATPAPAVKWQVSANGGAFTNIPNATSTTLSFVAALSQNGNQYRAVFTNAAGVATTSAATLAVTASNNNGGGEMPALTTTLAGGLPAIAVAGTKTTARQTLAVTNNTAAAINQSATVQLFVSTGPTFDATAVRVGRPVRTHLKIQPGGTQHISLPLGKFPAVAAGSYYVLAQLSSAAGASVATSNGSVDLQAPVINLSDSVTVVSPAVKQGKKAVIAVTVANSGNVLAKGRLQIALSASTDPSGSNPQLLRPAFVPIQITPSGRTVLRLLVPLPAALIPGSYYITATIDPNNAFAESNPGDNSANTVNTLNVI